MVIGGLDDRIGESEEKIFKELAGIAQKHQELYKTVNIIADLVIKIMKEIMDYYLKALEEKDKRWKKAIEENENERKDWTIRTLIAEGRTEEIEKYDELLKHVYFRYAEYIKNTGQEPLYEENDY